MRRLRLRVYANPAPAACALCVDDDGRILLTRRAWEPYAGMWDLPGGFLDEDEHPLDGLRRELAEETGLARRADRVVRRVHGSLRRRPDARWVLNLVWLARVDRRAAAPADDVSELALVRARGASARSRRSRWRSRSRAWLERQ